LGEEFIEIETLENLLEWIRQQRHEIIVVLNTDDGYPLLEIYDDYRE
jgi:hypothetical protein